MHGEKEICTEVWLENVKGRDNLGDLGTDRRIHIIIYFIILNGVRLNPLGIAATSGLLYQPQMIDDGDCGEICGIKSGRGTKVLGENLTQGHFFQHRSHMTRHSLEPRLPRWKVND
jgi:hypothetical protein